MNATKQTRKRGRKPIYPWDQWFARRRFDLVFGEHFHCDVRGMAQMARSRAAERRLSTSINVNVVKGKPVVRVTVLGQIK